MSRYPLMALFAMGVVVVVAGGALLLLGARVTPYIRFILPLPPIAVASYVFVSNLLSCKEVHKIGDIWQFTWDVVIASAVAAGAFLLFVSIMVPIAVAVSISSKEP